MKIYVQIKDPGELAQIQGFCYENHISTGRALDGLGTYMLDNVFEKLYCPNELLGPAIPESFKLKWDYEKIEALYNNKIIGRFNEGKLQWTLEDPKSMAPMIRVLMYGAEKYDRDNWKKACPKKLDLLDSLERHSKALIAGEAVDPESGLPHIGHLMCNAMFYSHWEQQTNGLFEESEI
jgi:hypothetical protein